MTDQPKKSPGFWLESWRQFRKRKLPMIALAYVVLLAMVALFAPFIAGTKPIICSYKGSIYFPVMGYYKRGWENPIFRKDRVLNRYPIMLQENDPNSWAVWPLVYQDPYRRIRTRDFAVRETNDQGERTYRYAKGWEDYQENPSGVDGKPSRQNWFGVNQQGFDVFASMVHGSQTALSVGIISMSIAAAIGITIGALAGYLGGWVDIVLSRLIEVVMCIPGLVLILALVALLDKVSNFHLMAVIGVTGWTGIARLTRAEFLKIKQMEFVTAARAIGAGRVRIMSRHVLRNALAPVLVPISFGIASAILTEAGLSYLGFGASPPNPSWGTLLQSGRTAIQETWWLILYPGAAIFLTVLAYNLIGEGLQEATDPRLQQAGH
ncbi:Glutathione transport system permease protein GsiD [Posidoniimonas polymericola]|uniref:Glutathione transport system permease protein GsiD n=1 Tax=Posidoniimonas polymericola TaxID=2528002 RepID=A0A5C5ZFC9_9BACT|nr:ABC transporter permease [Posidoniimonas polymericola]TWT85551.1 Glutathione transport system permease protein GsiD [Posidoniimonas polymericola]